MSSVAFTHLKKDFKLAALIEQVDPKATMTANTAATQDIYFALLDSIVSQQLAVKAADTIFKRFLNLFPDKYPHPEMLINIPDNELRLAGLSFQKASYLKNVAHFSLQNDISYSFMSQLNDDEIITYLTQIKGVGKWTVEMLLMFILFRPDVFPFDDLVVRNNIIKLYNLEGSGKELKKKIYEIADKWRPYRTIACKYIWKYKDLGRTN